MTFKHLVGRKLIPSLPLSEFAVGILRLELGGILVRAKYRFLPWKWWKKHQLRQGSDLYVNVACGGRLLEGFENLDLRSSPGVTEWDCGWSLPFSDESCKGIRAEHFLEHLDPLGQRSSFLLHCHRVLSPGGTLRIIVPDAGRFLRAYAAENESQFGALGWGQPLPKDLPTRMDAVNHIFHQWFEHRWAYDLENLTRVLTEAGFHDVRQVEFGSSRDSRLAQDREVHRNYSLYVEAVKA